MATSTTSAVYLNLTNDVFNKVRDEFVNNGGPGETVHSELQGAACEMAIKVAVFDPSENCPASSLVYLHMVGSFDDSTAVEEFAMRCGVLTVEIEHVKLTRSINSSSMELFVNLKPELLEQFRINISKKFTFPTMGSFCQTLCR